MNDDILIESFIASSILSNNTGMPHLLFHLVRHIDQSEPIEHPVDVSHSPDIPQRFRAVYHLSHLFHIP